jgi:predicted Zn-ribbon and HTH transcriptional regulator
MSSRRDLSDFLASRGARKACPLCGHEDWDGWDQRLTVPRALNGTEYEPLVVIPLLCRNCGFVRLHASHVLGDPRDESTGA